MTGEGLTVGDDEALLIDSSVWLAAFDQRDAHHKEARLLLQTTRFRHAALDLTLYEVANVAEVKWKDTAASRRLVEAIAVATEEWMVRADTELLEAASTAAELHRLSVYDAAYVAAKQRLGVRLVSLDPDLTGPGLAVTPAGVIEPAAA